MRVRRALVPVLGMLALVATACPEQPGGGGPTTTTSTTTTTLADNDGDGFNTGQDCNDNDPTINPGQAVDTVGDGVDSNCDGTDGIQTNTDPLLRIRATGSQAPSPRGGGTNWEVHHARTPCSVTAAGDGCARRHRVPRTARRRGYRYHHRTDHHVDDDHDAR